MKAEAQNTTEYTAWSREIVIEIDNDFYYGTLSYDNWNGGYEWDGDDIPGADTANQQWLYDLDGLTCDKDGCYTCEQNAKEVK
jgi:hypothetical protein